MIKVLVTGGSGQLGRSIKKIAPKFLEVQVIFLSSSELDITNKYRLKEYFDHNSDFDYCVNCAAYTAVDQAENHAAEAFLVNSQGVENLASACSSYGITLIHISTDFVFDGSANQPYTEEDQPNPLNIYGKSKLSGEERIKEILTKYFIIRTSWLYSEYGSNFVKTMIRLSKERDSIAVVDDQIGSPTYSGDLALVILKIITSASQEYGIYHYSNYGKISWFDFAEKIFESKAIDIDLTSIKTKDSGSIAKRPHYSVLDKKKIEEKFELKISKWDTKLNEVLNDIT